MYTVCSTSYKITLKCWEFTKQDKPCVFIICETRRNTHMQGYGCKQMILKGPDGDGNATNGEVDNRP